MTDAVRAAIKELKFQTNRKIEKEGERMRYVPDERTMAEADVLSDAMVDGQLVIVTRDGRKHRALMAGGKKAA